MLDRGAREMHDLKSLQKERKVKLRSQQLEINDLESRVKEMRAVNEWGSLKTLMEKIKVGISK